MIRFQSPQLPSVEQVAAYFTRANQRRWYSNRGPCHELLVERLEDFLGGIRCVPVANATLGLMLSLRALVGPGTGPRHEVLMPSFTFAAPINAVLWAGLEPVFVDVEEQSWHLDPNSLEDALRERGGTVAAILACSTFGVPPSRYIREAWEQAARRAGIPLIVDSAAGFGATAADGRPLGDQGDAEIFSFHATKPFAIGEGGVVTTAIPEVADRMTRLANFGFENGVIEAGVGLNAKLAEWPAATALAVLDSFDEVIARRRASAERILAEIEPHGFQRQAGGDGAVWQFVPVLAPSPAARAAALELSRRRGIELRSYFSIPLHRMPAFACVLTAGELRCTEDLADRALSLPMANDLSAVDLDAIVAALKVAVTAAA